MPPNVFDGLIGHATIARILSAALATPAPAYLFVGQPHLGKRTFAERFVLGLLAGASLSEGRPEGVPLRLDQIRSHPDLVVLEPEEGKKMVSVEQVRDLREHLSMRPLIAPRVVAFIPSADRLNESGSNALLKVLEEPPAGAAFVMVAEDIGRLPATVLSRSVSIPFRIVPRAEIVGGLVEKGFGKTDAERLAASAHGCPGLAILPPEGERPGEIFVRAFFSAKTLGAKLSRIEELAKTCESSEDANAEWRDAILSAMRSTGEILKERSVEATIFGIALATALRFIGSPVSPRLALEAGAVRISSSPEDEIRRLFPSHVPRPLPLLYDSLVHS